MRYPIYRPFILMTALFGLTTVAIADGRVQIDAVARLADGTPVGEAELRRFRNRINVVLRTSDLDPGAAMTVWWRIYNRPQHCTMPFACEFSDIRNPAVDGSQLHATGFVVEDADGTSTVVATLYRTAFRAQGGDPFGDSLAEDFLFGRGLTRPLQAEIEVVLASHGREADPVMDGSEAAFDQLTTPGATPLECAEPGVPSPARTFRCGLIQQVDHRAR